MGIMAYIACVEDKRHTAFLIGCAFLTYAAVLLAEPPAAQAGCNSGNVANTAFLSDAACEAAAAGINATAVGPGSTASGTNSSAYGLNSTASGTHATAVGGSGDGITTFGARATGVFASAFGAFSTASGALSTASGVSSTASGSASSAYGDGSTASSNFSSAYGSFSTASGISSTASGISSTASGISSSAYGSFSTASGTNSTAIGVSASATFANSAAFGNAATATRADQQVFGSVSNTYTMPGITSAPSKAAQSGPTQIVTSDVGGNLATSTLANLGIASSGDISAINSNLGAINSRLDDLTSRSNRAYTGIAMAFAMAGVPTVLPNERFAIAGNWGTFEGANGLALNAAARITDNLQFNAGIGYGPDERIIGGRAGLRFGW
jgi:YadA-like membrane anchor domain/Head domain of trimeric autotransporter adhesin